jgi:hypothetical protein
MPLRRIVGVRGRFVRVDPRHLPLPHGDAWIVGERHGSIVLDDMPFVDPSF